MREAKARGESPSLEQLAQLPSAESWYQWSSRLSFVAMLICIAPVVMVVRGENWKQRSFAIIATVITVFLWWTIPSWRT